MQLLIYAVYLYLIIEVFLYAFRRFQRPKNFPPGKNLLMTFFPFHHILLLSFNVLRIPSKHAQLVDQKIFTESQRKHASHEIGSFNLTSKWKTRVSLGYLELLTTLINLIHMCIKNVEQWINLRIIEIKSFLIGIFGGWGHSENDIELTNRLPLWKHWNEHAIANKRDVFKCKDNHVDIKMILDK